jgi:hypothetical protein
LLDFKAIAQTPILDVLGTLGIELKETTADIRGEKVQQYVGVCPISKASNATAFKVTPSLNRWFCFCATCKAQEKKGGDCIELVKRVKNIDYRAAAQLIKGADEGASNPSPKQEAASTPSKDTTFDSLKYVQSLDPEHDALSHLQIDPATFILFKAGYCSKGLNRGRLAIAWHDIEGTLKFFIGVALDATVPRYIAPKGVDMPYFFGVDRIEEGEGLQILTDVFAVMRAYENGATNIICPLRPCDSDALESLRGLIMVKKLTVEF